MQKTNKIWGMYLVLVFIGVLTFGCSYLAYANQNFGPKSHTEEYPWILRKDQQGVRVYTRKVSQSPILEYKANIVVDAPLDKVITLFEDDEKVPLWFYHGVRADLIEQRDDLERVYYFIARLPWPISARDTIFQRIKLKDAVSGEITYKLISMPKRLPKKKGVVRVIKFKASWSFIPLLDGRTEIHFQQHAHPEGFIPPFMANTLVTDVPFYSLINFRSLIESTNRP